MLLCQAVYNMLFPNGAELSRSRQDFRPIRFNLKRQTLASFVYVGVAPLPACPAGSKVLLVVRVAPLRVVFPPDRRRRRRSGGNVLGLRDRANGKTHTPSEASSLGSKKMCDTHERPVRGE